MSYGAFSVKNLTLSAVLTLALGAGLLVGTEAQVRQDIPRLKAQEFDGINQILGVIDNTSIRRVDKKSQSSFLEYSAVKEALNNQASQRVRATTPATRSIRGMQAPKSLDQRAF